MESTAKTSKTPNSPALKARRCRYCKASFRPRRTQDAEQRFCSPTHRKAFHKYGGLPFDKLMDRVRRELREIVRAEIGTQQASALAGSPLATGTIRAIVREELAAATFAAVLAPRVERAP